MNGTELPTLSRNQLDSLVQNRPRRPQQPREGDTVNTMALARSMMVGIGISIAALAISPTMSAADQKQDTSSQTGPPLLLALNDDQLTGKWKQFKGELKKKWGNFTDDDILYIEGNRDKLEGKIQERYGDRKDEVKKWVDDWFAQNKTRNIQP